MTLAQVHADARVVLAGWTPPDVGQAALAQAFLSFLAAREDACARGCVPGHLTASAVVVSADGGSTLLTLHPRVGRWLQLGGHCEEGDRSLAAVALREATEESGINGLVLEGPGPVHLDVHPITCSLGVPTRHFDVRYLIRAPAGAAPVRSDESDDLRFFTFAQLAELTGPERPDASLLESLSAAAGRGGRPGSAASVSFPA